MPQDLSAFRDRAHDMEREMEAKISWLSVRQLAARWGLAESTVRDIPREALPFIEFGKGRRYRRRRYDPADVAAYEAASKDPGAPNKKHAA